MVHALSETWRVLRSPGRLVDLRPVSTRCPIDAVTSDRAVEIGEVDATGMAEDDDAADLAIQEMVANQWFVPRRHGQFDFDFYWDDVQEMASFLEGSRRSKHVHPSYQELEEAHCKLSLEWRREVRLRCRRRTMLAVYDKAPRLSG